MKGLEILGWDINCDYICWQLNGKPGNSAIKDGEVIDAHLCDSPSYAELLSQDVIDEIKNAIAAWLADDSDQDPLYIFQLSSHTTNYVKHAVVIAHTAVKALDLMMQTHPDLASIWGEAGVTEIAPLGKTGPFDPVVLAVEEW